MSRELLKDLIQNFSPEDFIHFFRQKNRSFRPFNEPASQYNNDGFKDCLHIGEIPFNITDRLIIYSFQVNKDLTERSGKKLQYEKGKRLLKDTNADSGIFIFYDTNNNFRFSLIYAEYYGIRRIFSYFRRLTFFVSPRFTNKTFLQQIGECDFSNFKSIKEAFSIEPITKQFYGELQYWFFWAMDKIKFPDDYKYSNDPAKNKEIRNATNLIRLITRIIFIWFLTEKGLISSELFSREKLEKVVKDFMKDKKASNFYNAILQNLFFGTLNQKMDERKFAQESGYPANIKEYGVKNLYRYSNKFLISKDKVLQLFKNIPFLNGGLFDCLDKENGAGKVIYVDGFSRNLAKQSIIPDYLFFQQEEERVDLSHYGLGKGRPVMGLIEILNSYNFTIDENTPVDQEIALDPELLGKVFENLLVSYNPETATTARKATGSYYTPREIVDYMVEESLFEYLRKVAEIEEDIRMLLSYSEEVPEFSEPERQKIISAIDDIKILDPACGSGAFPMGILHKLVYSLQKLDPENKYWHELQYQKALRESEEVFKQDDKNERQERLREINEAFDEGINYPDYARKLYLIENCIYGVDIQSIAIQISKLRFFISLVLDQKVDRGKENLGIRALPNLETKFVAANTLIGLDRPTQLAFKNPDIEKKEEELKRIRHKYFEAKTRKEKLDYQKKDQQIRKEIADLLEHCGWDTSTAEKIATFDLYDQNASFNWFDPEWMFGIKNPSPLAGKGEGGFDIIIANPPYIGEKGHKEIFHEIKKGSLGKFYQRKMDIFYFFFHLALNLGKQNSNIGFITTNYYPTATGATKLRQDFKKRAIIKNLINFNELKIFESALGQHNMITVLEKVQNENGIAQNCVTQRQGTSTPELLQQILSGNDAETHYYKVVQKDLYDGNECYIRLIGNSMISRNSIQVILEKVKTQNITLGDICNVNQGILTGADKVSNKHIRKFPKVGFNKGEGVYVLNNNEVKNIVSKEIIKPWFKNSDILKYYTKRKSDEYLLYLTRDINLSDYNDVQEHIKKFEKIIRSRPKDRGEIQAALKLGKWWVVFAARKNIPFNGAKIVVPQRSQLNTFGYNEIPWYASADVYFITERDNSIYLKYVLALLNSKLYYLWLYHRGKRKGEMLELYQKPLSEIPIKKISRSAQQPFIALVDQILATKKKDPNADTSTLEQEIDKMVYELYGLTNEEILLVEGEKN